MSNTLTAEIQDHLSPLIHQIIQREANRVNLKR